MNTQNIRTIGIEDFKLDPHLIDYVDENVIVLDNVDSTIASDERIRLDCFMMTFCIEGEVSVMINSKTFQLKADHCMILLPTTIVQRASGSICNARIVAVDPGFLRNVTNSSKETWNIVNYLHNNPIFPINRNTSYKFYLYKELALTCIKEKPSPFLRKAKKHLFSAIFCEIMSKLYEDIPIKDNMPNFRNDRSVYIFRRFMELVAADDGTHRSVSYYANKLCYSSKHISTVVKKICGKGPLTLINEHAMECIKYELKHSDKSIKEVADRFDFVNPSFFGKFVKTHTGMSPLQFRNSEEDDTAQ